MSDTVGASDPVPASEYNPIFEKFVDDADGNRAQVIGLVAYGLYKTRKREWACQIRAQHHRGPNESELQHYTNSWTASMIEGARSNAADIMASFAQSVIADEEPRILKKAIKGSAWRNIVQSITANFVYTLLLIGFAVVLAISGVDLVGILKNIAGP